MKNTASPNLLTGNGFTAVLSFSIPMMIGAIVEQLYSSADSIIAGNFIGSNALAAIGATATVIFFVFSLNSGLANGSCIIIAQAYGEGEESKIRRAIVGACYYTVGCIMIISSLGILFIRPLLELLQTPADIIEDSTAYLRIYVGFSFGQIIYSNISAMVRALGDSRTPLLFLILCAILNVFLDLLFVAVFGWGVEGAAAATVLSQTISGLMCIIYAVRRYPFFRIRKGDVLPDWNVIYGIAKIGIPMGAYSSVLAVGDMMIAGLVNTYGSVMVAAFSAADRIHQFCVIPFFNFALAFSTFTAQNFGAGQFERIKETVSRSVKFLAVIALAMGTAIMTLRFGLLSIFVPNTDVNYSEIMRIGGEFLAYVPWFYTFLAWIWLFNYILRGFGISSIPIISGIIELV